MVIDPDLRPMLARLEHELPGDGYLYEPKWDGFRCLAVRDGDETALRSRHGRPLTRYFPELGAALSELAERRFVLDGEILVTAGGGFDFDALLRRVHPAVSRARELSEATPATLIAFDLLALGGEDLRREPFEIRRARLAELLDGYHGRVALTPITDDRERARKWLEASHGPAIDGVVAKHRSLPYRCGERAMIKVKLRRTADCVVAGLRLQAQRPAVASLLLAMYDAAGGLVHVGVCSSFRMERRLALAEELLPLVVALDRHPWRDGFLLEGGPVGRLRGSAGRWTPDMPRDWIPLAPERACEIGYDQVDRRRFRHPARFLRWRPDREPRSCLVDQLDPPAAS
jgi:ATP-dependent DNA ligase